MIRKLLISVVVFLSPAVLVGQTKRNQVDFSATRLGDVLYCLQAKLSAYGDAPPRFEAHSFRVRYVYGKFDPADEDDEVHLVVYGPGEESGTLFEVYLHGMASAKPELLVGEPATLKSEHGQLVIDENPGGVATFRRIEKLLLVISRRPAVTVRKGQVKAGSLSCAAGP